MIKIKYITLEQGTAAHQGSSFSPEKRGQSHVDEYKKYMKATEIKLKQSKLWTEEYADIIQTCFDKYYSLYSEWLYKKSRCMSTMITGSSNFPVRSNQKKVDSEHKALEILLSFDIVKEVKRRIKKRKKYQDIQERVDSGNYETILIKEFHGGKIVNNKAAERVQIYFDEKPNEEIRRELKNNAFRFSPRNDNAWQRKNTVNGIFAAKRIIEKLDGGVPMKK